jgi:hydrogenase expression/formation protein HypE
MPDLEKFTCPVPLAAGDRVLLAHGGGGKLSQQLIERVFLPAFRNPALEARHDGALLRLPVGQIDDLPTNAPHLAFTTDAYVVRPLFFPGGNIGDLAVNGTVNDLAMCGARPLWLSAAFILEEGLPMETLSAVVESMRQASAAAGVELVTGDTKVVDRGSADEMFVTTAGIGVIEGARSVGPQSIQPGDAVIVSGDLGCHGVAVLSVREGLEFEAPIESDCAPLWSAVEALFAAGIEVHCLRDLTRGGLASALNELASARAVHITIEETAIPVREVVRAACELLGLDPLYVANEGRFCAFVPARAAGGAVEVLRALDVSRRAARIGHVVEGRPEVVMESRIGGTRVVDMLSGEQLPRIC